jgi:hypothetical protein
MSMLRLSVSQIDTAYTKRVINAKNTAVSPPIVSARYNLNSATK